MGHILITGGFGYVGGRITHYLADVVGRTNLRILTRRGPDRIPGWSEGIEVVGGDLREPASLVRAVAKADTVVHLAAAHEVTSWKDPDEALEVTGRGTYRLLQAAKEARVRRFVYFSTFHVYGPWARGRITEETATRPVHPYAITHRLAEDYVNWFRHTHGLETLILRLSNAVGYPADPLADRWTLVFNDLCRQAVLDGRLRLKSDGSQLRDFIPLSDVVRVVEHCLNLPDWGDGLFNLGTGRSMSVLKLAQIIGQTYAASRGKQIPVERGPQTSDRPPPPIHFDVEKLLATGFILRGQIEEEAAGNFELIEQELAAGGRLETV